MDMIYHTPRSRSPPDQHLRIAVPQSSGTTLSEVESKSVEHGQYIYDMSTQMWKVPFYTQRFQLATVGPGGMLLI